MNQTRAESLIEALINTLIGFVVSYAAWPFAAMIAGMEYSHSQHFGIVVFFTVISVARSYAIRRFFNSHLQSASRWIARFIFGSRT